MTGGNFSLDGSVNNKKKVLDGQSVKWFWQLNGLWHSEVTETSFHIWSRCQGASTRSNNWMRMCCGCSQEQKIDNVFYREGWSISFALTHNVQSTRWRKRTGNKKFCQTWNPGRTSQICAQRSEWITSLSSTRTISAGDQRKRCYWLCFSQSISFNSFVQPNHFRKQKQH